METEVSNKQDPDDSSSSSSSSSSSGGSGATRSSGDSSYEFRLFEIEDAYYIKRSDIDIYFSLSALDYDRLNDVIEYNAFVRSSGEMTVVEEGTVGS